MSPVGLAFLIILVLSLLILPREKAAFPLLLGACYMTQAQSLVVGPFHFWFMRLVLAAGIARVMLRREGLGGRWDRLDTLMVLWAAWALVSSLGHRDPQAAFISNLGLVYENCGLYFLLRIFIPSRASVGAIVAMAALILVPVAAEMVWEKIAGQNLFSIFGGVPETPAIREGRIRAQGPFRHAILAGTVGATMLPLMVGLWQVRHHLARVGALACLVMIIASASSGPVLSLLAGIGALLLWPWRENMRVVRYAAVAGYVLLDLVMIAPAYYLIARIDVVGGSTGWHRAKLIESAIEHLHEWWWTGTDYTRHWMPTGVSWSPEHTDITNHYLHLGVVGGLPLMVLFLAVLWRAFACIGDAVRDLVKSDPKEAYLVWTVGAALFAHAATMISVSYFDQSRLFLLLVLAASPVLKVMARQEQEAETPTRSRLVTEVMPVQLKGNGSRVRLI